MRSPFPNKPSNPLLLLRAVSCLLVVGSHVQRPELHAGLLKQPFGWLNAINGHFGVWVFFILSGYLIGKGFFSGRYTWSVAGLREYYLRRWVKVYIPYVLTALGILFLYKADFFRSAGVMRDVVLLRGNAVYLVEELSYLWTISSIVLWYLIAPVFCRLFLFLRNKKTAILLVGAGILIAGQTIRAFYIAWYPSETFPEFNAQVFIHFLPNLSFFLMGAWVNLLKLPLLKGEGWGEVYNRYIAIAGLFLAYHLATYYLSAVYIGYSWSFIPYETTAAFVTILAVLWCIIAAEKTNWRLPLMPLTVIGVYSYQLYLLQTPLIKMLQLECSAAWCPTYVVFFRSLLVVILALAISFGVKSLLQVSRFIRWQRHS